MKFKEEVCGNCGSDLTTAELPHGEVREMPMKGEMIFLGECPKCHTNRIMVAEEPVAAPAKARGGRQKISKPPPEEEAPAEEAPESEE